MTDPRRPMAAYSPGRAQRKLATGPSIFLWRFLGVPLAGSLAFLWRLLGGSFGGSFGVPLAVPLVVPAAAPWVLVHFWTWVRFPFFD